jgi:hypothetical protein
MFSTQLIKIPENDCDIVLQFPSGKELHIQCRPSNADINYNGSLDIILPEDMSVTNWQGDDMHPAPLVNRRDKCTHFAKQLVLELL